MSEQPSNENRLMASAQAVLSDFRQTLSNAPTTASSTSRTPTDPGVVGPSQQAVPAAYDPGTGAFIEVPSTSLGRGRKPGDSLRPAINRHQAYAIPKLQFVSSIGGAELSGVAYEEIAQGDGGPLLLPDEDPCAHALQQANELIALLGSEDPGTRRSAFRELSALAKRCPEVVIPLLKNNAGALDPEVNVAIQQILDPTYALWAELMLLLNSLTRPLQNPGQPPIGDTITVLDIVNHACELYDLLKDVHPASTECPEDVTSAQSLLKDLCEETSKEVWDRSNAQNLAASLQAILLRLAKCKTR